MKKQVFKNKEKGAIYGVCYGLVKSLEIEKDWLEKTVLYVLRGIFLLTGLAVIGAAFYLTLDAIMIDENDEEKREKDNWFVNLRKNRIPSYVVTGLLLIFVMFCFSPLNTTSEPLGEKGMVSPCVSEYLSQNLRNPGSLDVMSCSDVMKVEDGKYVQKVRYRAANGFGGYSIETKKFYIEKDGREWEVSYAY